MYNGKRCAPPDTKTQKTTGEKLGTYPATNAVTQNLWGLKVKKDTTLKMKKVNVRELR